MAEAEPTTAAAAGQEAEPVIKTPKGAARFLIAFDQDFRCNIATCQAVLHPQNMDIDHIRPRSLDGLTVRSNLQAICRKPCHAAKSAKEAGDRSQTKRRGMADPKTDVAGKSADEDDDGDDGDSDRSNGNSADDEDAVAVVEEPPPAPTNRRAAALNRPADAKTGAVDPVQPAAASADLPLPLPSLALPSSLPSSLPLPPLPTAAEPVPAANPANSKTVVGSAPAARSATDRSVASKSAANDVDPLSMLRPDSPVRNRLFRPTVRIRPSAAPPKPNDAKTTADPPADAKTAVVSGSAAPVRGPVRVWTSNLSQYIAESQKQLANARRCLAEYLQTTAVGCLPAFLVSDAAAALDRLRTDAAVAGTDLSVVEKAASCADIDRYSWQMLQDVINASAGRNGIGGLAKTLDDGTRNPPPFRPATAPPKRRKPPNPPPDAKRRRTGADTPPS
jgi:hypothetical protein